jgi:hypothetical protein
MTVNRVNVSGIGIKQTHDYLFDSERRYKTFIIKLVIAMMRIARAIVKNRASFIEYNIDTKETLPRNNMAYIDTCFFLPSFFSILIFPPLFDSISIRVLTFMRISVIEENT